MQNIDYTKQEDLQGCVYGRQSVIHTTFFREIPH